MFLHRDCFSSGFWKAGDFPQHQLRMQTPQQQTSHMV